MKIALLGGGPSSLFMYKRLTESNIKNLEIVIFEKKSQLGAGMPYSADGANKEHITNVSANEIPEIVTSIAEWIQTVPEEILKTYSIDKSKFNEYKVLPRLLFGKYLEAQYKLLKQNAAKIGIKTVLHLNSPVSDISDKPSARKVLVKTATEHDEFDHIVICTGHSWPTKYEGKVPGYFDSPYPPAKLAMRLNHAVAVRGSSLTAIDAIRTLARNNGTFSWNDSDQLSYQLSGESPDFRIVMHSRNGLLPAVRFHLEDSHLSNDSLLTPEEIAAHMDRNDGFLSLDYIFKEDYKALLADRDPELYEHIKDMRIEEFVPYMMELRERLEPFTLLKAEYAEAKKSIRRHESVYWKELLATLSFAMNYPAKHFSAEDMLRLQKVLMPLISIVIAFVPQSSCEELMALHDAGILDLVAVGDASTVTAEKNGGATVKFETETGEEQSVFYQTFVDSIGQPHLSYEDFPFRGLIEDQTVVPAKIRFRDPENGLREKSAGNDKVEPDSNGGFYLKVPGISINDQFQVTDGYGAYNPRISIMAVPYIGGFNPDYSGLDFCEAASASIIEAIARELVFLD